MGSKNVERILSFLGLSKEDIARMIGAYIAQSAYEQIDEVEEQVKIATYLNEQINLPGLDEVKEQVIFQELVAMFADKLKAARDAISGGVGK